MTGSSRGIESLHDLEAAEAHHGVTVASGDILVVAWGREARRRLSSTTQERQRYLPIPDHWPNREAWPRRLDRDRPARI